MNDLMPVPNFPATPLTETLEASKDAPLSGPAWQNLFAALGLTAARPVAIAVSGGPDSMALAWGARLWRDGANAVSPAPLLALIVDHQLRPESSDEAMQVRDRLAALNVPAAILRWQHPAITSRVHVLARQARFDLLTQACRERGIADLLLAHHRDDQAETILMRLAKGSGVDGLAGMAERSERDGVRLLRPLLRVPKTRLVATCKAANLPYVTDPSNAKPSYARGRLRQTREALAQEGLTASRLVDLGDRAREASSALDHYARALLNEAASVHETGAILLNLAPLRLAPSAVALRAVTACLRAIHKGAYGPERAALLPLLAKLAQPAAMPARTLHGCLVWSNGQRATFAREPAAIAAITPVVFQETALWDERWQVTLLAKSSSLAKSAASSELPARAASPAQQAPCAYVIRALGYPAHAALDALAPGLRQRIPQARLRASLPALWQQDELKAIPVLGSANTSGAQAQAELRQPSGLLF